MKKILLAVSAVLSVGVFESNAQCGVFYDGFESGAFNSPWAMGTGIYTVTVPNTTPAVGTYNLQLASTGTGSFYEGARAIFTASQPTYMSWRMKTNTTTAANGYVVIGDGNIAGDNGVIFCYFNATSGLRFFNTTGYNHPIVANTWYHVEARNINWTSRTSDIYVNNVLILPGWAFRSGAATTIDRVHMFSLSAATAEYDEIVIGTLPVTATAIQTNVDCFGNATGSATVTAAGGDGIYTYSWSPSGGTLATATGLAANTYICTITDGVGCTTTQTVVITEPPLLTAAPSQTNVSCNGGSDGTASVLVTGGTGPYSYLWSPSGGTAATATGLVGGTYACTITDANGCSLTQSVTLTQPSALLSASTATHVTCYGGSDGGALITIMGGTSPYNVLWSPSGNTTTFITGVQAGTHVYTVTDANGCILVDSLVINQPPQIATNVSGSPTICAGASTTLSASPTGGTGSFTYQWSPGNQTTSSITVNPSATTTHYITVTDSVGCTQNDSVVIAVNPLPVVNLGADTSACGTLVLDAQNSGATYLWTGGFTTQTLPVTTSGMYAVWVTDAAGCTGADSINITISTIAINLGADTSTCGASVVLDAQTAGTYLWSDSSTAQTLTVTTSGTYYVDVTDANGCVGTDTIDVMINSAPTVIGTASSTTPCADDANVMLVGTPAGGTWSGTSVTGSQFDPSIGAGTYPVTYTYTDVNGCTGSHVIPIVVSTCVGIEEYTDPTIVNAYPNPNNGTFTLAVHAAVTDLVVEITDVQGRVVYSSSDANVQNGFTRQISLENEASGIYFMRVIADGIPQTQKISVQK